MRSNAHLRFGLRFFAALVGAGTAALMLPLLAGIPSLVQVVQGTCLVLGVLLLARVGVERLRPGRNAPRRKA